MLTFTIRSVEGHEVQLRFPQMKKGDEALMLHEILQSLATGVREAVRVHAGDAADKANIGGDFKLAGKEWGE